MMSVERCVGPTTRSLSSTISASVGLIACVPVWPIINKYPSGAAFLMVRAAALPAPPGRLSMMTGCPMLSETFWPSRRMTISELPPAGNGTMMVMGCDG